MSSLKPLTIQPLPLECAICKEEIKDDLLALNHKVNDFVHHFHHECAKEWLKEHPTCPICSVEADPSQVIPIMIASKTLAVKYAADAFSYALDKRNVGLQEILINQISNQPELGPELLSRVVTEYDEMFDKIASLCDLSLTETHRVFAMNAIGKNDLDKVLKIIGNSPDPQATTSTLLFFSVGCFLKGYCDRSIPLSLIEKFGGDFGFNETFISIASLLKRNELRMVDTFLDHSSLEPEVKERIRKDLTERRALHHALKLIKEKNLEALKKIVETGNLDASAGEIIEAVIENFDELPDFLLDLCSKGSIFSLTNKAFKSKKLKLCLQILCATQDEFSARHICELCLKENLIDFYKDLLKTIKFEDPSKLVIDATRKKSFEACEAIINQYELDGYSTLLLFQFAIEERNISFIKTLIAQCSLTSSIPKPFEEKREEAWEIKGVLRSLSNFITEEKQLELAREFFNRKPIDRELFAEFLSFFKENAEEVFMLIPERIRESVLMIATLENPYNLDHLKVLFDDEFVNDALIQFVLKDSRSIPPEIIYHKALNEETMKEAIEIARENGNESLVDDLIFRLPILEASLYRLLYVQCTIS